MGRLLFVLLVAGFAVVAPRVQAEGALMRTEPAADAEVAAFDGKVRAWFSGNVSPRAPSLLVVDRLGQRMDKGDVSLKAGPRSELSVTTGALQPGPYVVRYRVLTNDGLVVSGIFRFSVKS